MLLQARSPAGFRRQVSCLSCLLLSRKSVPGIVPGGVCLEHALEIQGSRVASDGYCENGQKILAMARTPHLKVPLAQPQ